MASIETRKSKDGSRTSYRVIWRDDGRRQTLTLPTQGDAEHWKALLEAHGHSTTRAEAALLAERSAAPTVERAVAEHIARLYDVTVHTRATYERMLANWIAPQLGHLPVDTVTEDDVAALVAAMVAARRSPKTIRNVHALLNATMVAAIRRGDRAGSNPCEVTRLPKAQHREESMAFLTHAEFAGLLAHVDPFFRPHVLFLVGTGLRFSEAAALEPGDFTMSSTGKPEVRVTKAWKRDAGNGRHIGPPKSKAGRRTVGLDEGTARVVAPLVQSAKPGTQVFVMKRGGEMTVQSFHNKVWRPAVRAAQADGLRKSPRVHDLRHTFASWQLAEGMELAKLSKIMGHESYATTMRVYAHLTEDGREAGAAAMGASMAKVWQAAEGLGLASRPLPA